jgi:hypothetical protein
MRDRVGKRCNAVDAQLAIAGLDQRVHPIGEGLISNSRKAEQGCADLDRRQRVLVGVRSWARDFEMQSSCEEESDS